MVMRGLTCRAILIIALVFVCAGTFVAWVTSYSRPVRITRLGASVVGGDRRYIIRSQGCFSSGGTLHVWLSTAVSQRELYAKGFVHVNARDPARIESGALFAALNKGGFTFPLVFPGPMGSGFNHSRWGFSVYSRVEGAAYEAAGGWLPDSLYGQPGWYGIEGDPQFDDHQRWLSRHERGVIVPWWSLFIASAAAPAARLLRIPHRRRQRRLRLGLCPSCAYDLRATPGRCPECGAST